MELLWIFISWRLCKDQVRGSFENSDSENFDQYVALGLRGAFLNRAPPVLVFLTLSRTLCSTQLFRSLCVQIIKNTLKRTPKI